MGHRTGTAAHDPSVADYRDTSPRKRAGRKLSDYATFPASLAH